MSKSLTKQFAGRVSGDRPDGSGPFVGTVLEMWVAEEGGETVALSRVRTDDGDVVVVEARHTSVYTDRAIDTMTIEEWRRHIRDNPFVPTQAMLDEDWSDLIPEGRA